MKLAISVMVVLGIGLFLLFAVAMLVVDMAARIDYVQTHAPRLVEWAKRRRSYGILLLIAVLLLIANLYELTTIMEPIAPLPQILFRPPVAPVLQVRTKDPQNQIELNRLHRLQTKYKALSFAVELLDFAKSAIQEREAHPWAARQEDETTMTTWRDKYESEAVKITNNLEAMGVGVMHWNYRYHCGSEVTIPEQILDCAKDIRDTAAQQIE